MGGSMHLRAPVGSGLGGRVVAAREVFHPLGWDESRREPEEEPMEENPKEEEAFSGSNSQVRSIVYFKGRPSSRGKQDGGEAGCDDPNAHVVLVSMYSHPQ